MSFKKKYRGCYMTRPWISKLKQPYSIKELSHILLIHSAVLSNVKACIIQDEADRPR
jgi:hypothetical protein